MEQVLKLLIVAVIIFAVSLYARRVKRNPNRDKRDPNKMRVPKIVPFIGWFFVIIGALMGFVILASPPSTAMPLGAKITALGVLLGGLFFLFVYHRWYIVVGTDRVTTQRVFSGVVTTRYQDIVERWVTTMNQQHHLTIKALDGTKQTINISQYNASPLLNWLEFKDAVGRDPRPLELEHLAATGQWPQGATEEAQDRAALRDQLGGQGGANGQPAGNQNRRSPIASGTQQAGMDSGYTRPEPFITDMSSLYGKKRKKRD